MHMQDVYAIQTQELVKHYGRVRALRGLELEVTQGEIFGFLGPNGAGKTTTIRCLLNLIHPDGGTIQVLGLNPQRQGVKVRARTGYLPGELHLEESLTVRATLRYLRALRKQKVDWSYVNQLAERLSLDMQQTVKNLSKGNKQKLGLIQAMMHRPDLLLLDEPTSGLDPLVQQEVLRMIQSARAEGATVFFSSHVLSEVQEIADRVGIIRQGQMVEVAETQSLIERAFRRAHIRFKSPVDTNFLESIPGVQVLSTDSGLAATIQIEGDMDPLIKALAVHPVRELDVERPSLEEIFLTYYSENREKEA